MSYNMLTLDRVSEGIEFGGFQGGGLGGGSGVFLTLLKCGEALENIFENNLLRFFKVLGLVKGVSFKGLQSV